MLIFVSHDFHLKWQEWCVNSWCPWRGRSRGDGKYTQNSHHLNRCLQQCLDLAKHLHISEQTDQKWNHQLPRFRSENVTDGFMKSSRRLFMLTIVYTSNQYGDLPISQQTSAGVFLWRLNWKLALPQFPWLNISWVFP